MLGGGIWLRTNKSIWLAGAESYTSRKADMPAGSYTLEVAVRGRNSRKLERKQWLEFEIRR